MRLQFCLDCRLVRVEPEFTERTVRWHEQHVGYPPGEWGCRGVSGVRETPKPHQWRDLSSEPTAAQQAWTDGYRVGFKAGELSEKMAGW